MESDLTKRRPSLIPDSLPSLPAGWTPSFQALGEDDEQSEANNFSSIPLNSVDELVPINKYNVTPTLVIKKFQSAQKTAMSMAHTHGVCVLNTEAEEILACDHYNNRLLLFDSQDDGHLIECFRGDLSTPEYVAPRPHYRQQIYITKAHSISLYDLEKKKFIQRLGSNESGHANNRFNSPCGITVDPDNGEIYMCDTWNYRVCVFSPDFRYVNRRWYLTRWQQIQNKVKPNFIAINNKDQCVVTCDDVPNYRGAVYVFDKMGYIQKIYDRESKDKPPNVETKLNAPHGILLDNQGNWLTCCYSDSERSCVERRANDNDETMSYWSNKNLKGPSALAIKRDRTLVIGDRDDNSISLFQPFD